MLLQLNNAKNPMKLVYLLSEELKSDPDYMISTQKLTLDESKPYIGLNGTYGLFGDEEWWENIRQQNMPLLFLSGMIKKAYVAGQDSSKFNNTIDLLLDDGSLTTIGIYVNNEEDAKDFREGHLVEVVYALDELKPLAARNFGQKHNKIALEMAISFTPVINN